MRTLTEADRIAIQKGREEMDKLSTLTPLERMKQELATKRAEAKKDRVEQLEMINMTREMDKLDNPTIQLAIAKREAVQANLLKLQTIKEELESVDPVTKSDRTVEVWASDSRYGTEVAQIVGILGAIDFAFGEMRENMLESIGLDEDLVTTTLDSLGRRGYISKSALAKDPTPPKEQVVFPATEGDAQEAHIRLDMVAEALCLTPVDTSKVTQKLLNKKRDESNLKIETEWLNHLTAIEYEQD